MKIQITNNFRNYFLKTIEYFSLKSAYFSETVCVCVDEFQFDQFPNREKVEQKQEIQMLKR